jgi:hypothetical protein
MKNVWLVFLCISSIIVLQEKTFAQKAKKKISVKDSIDAKFDLSNYIVDANGFVPIPIIITEPALGGFGGGLVPVFIKKNAQYLDSIHGKLVRTTVAPDITGGMAMYTVNNSWLLGAFRSGTIVKSRIKYLAAFGYGNINMSFYNTDKTGTETEYPFNFRMLHGIVQATRRLGFSHWYAGMKFQLTNSGISYRAVDSLPPDMQEHNGYTTLVTLLGGIVELDNRDNVFTPDRGMKVHVDVQRSDNIFGSDYDYWRFNYYAYMYKRIARNLTGGFRIDGQQVAGDAPFFMLPYIDMRGIPAMRYQGKADLLTEVEGRWDFTPRWSLLFFGGTGKAFDSWNDFGSEEWVYSYGSGFRYLLAREFKLRVGIDIAKGPPGSWGYYIVFGSNWAK